MSDPTPRRAFVKTAGAAAVAASLFPDHLWAQRPSRRRYAIVGTGLTGIAIRNSIDQKKPVRIADLVTV